MAQPLPPPFTPAPDDQALATRISKLAEYYTRNGPAFEELLKSKQRDNVDYAFLFGGSGYDFYAWCLFCMHRGLPIDRPLPADFVDTRTGAVTTAPPHGAADMPEEVASGFRQVLDLLNGTQESIKASSAWFLACSMHAAGMAEMMMHRLQTLPDFPGQLNIIYLINDILFASSRHGPGVDRSMAAVFATRLGPVMATAYKTSGCSAEALAQLQQLLHLWGSHGMFDAAAIEQVTAAIHAVGPSAPAAVAPAAATPAVPHVGGLSAAPQGGAAAFQGAAAHVGAPHAWQGHNPPLDAASAAPWGVAPQPGAPHAAAPGFVPGAVQPGVWGAPAPSQFPPAQAQPHGMPYPGPYPAAAAGAAQQRGGRWGPPAPEAAPFPAAQALPAGPQPYDILSFPAGIIPKLLRRHLRYEPPYTPLTPDDIDQEPPPPLPEEDSYMKSRLEKYYAEVAEYRPGMTRAKYEETRKQGTDSVDYRDGRERHGDRIVADKAPDDGSYTGGPQFERGGLGSHAATSDDPYALYRRNRSGRYHEIMAQKSTNVHRPPRGY